MLYYCLVRILVPSFQYTTIILINKYLFKFKGLFLCCHSACLIWDHLRLSGSPAIHWRSPLFLHIYLQLQYPLLVSMVPVHYMVSLDFLLHPWHQFKHWGKAEWPKTSRISFILFTSTTIIWCNLRDNYSHIPLHKLNTSYPLWTACRSQKEKKKKGCVVSQNQISAVPLMKLCQRQPLPPDICFYVRVPALSNAKLEREREKRGYERAHRGMRGTPCPLPPPSHSLCRSSLLPG